MLKAIFSDLRAALTEREPERKCARVAALLIPQGEFSAPSFADDHDGANIPGRPDKPELLQPRDVPHRGLGSALGRAALAHAVAHIEFNAINLALDACWRFRDLPADYYRDWLSVAQDEARHFLMLQARLRDLGHAYGDFAAHNGLWEAAEKTASDVIARMALVPRVLEARGLDVTPQMIVRLQEAGDAQTAAVLGVILEEEVRHVAIGTRWFRWLCEARGIEPNARFRKLLAEHNMRIRLPLNRAARSLAGFNDEELTDAR